MRTVRRLEADPDRAVVEADPMVIADDTPPVLLDEWHRVPSVWDSVRRLVDHDPAGGQFLLTGSPPMAGTHSGAGRIASLRLRPLTLTERGVAAPQYRYGCSPSATALRYGVPRRCASPIMSTRSSLEDSRACVVFPSSAHDAARRLPRAHRRP